LNQIAAFFNECHHCFVSPSNRALETHDMLSGYSFPDFQLPDLVVEPRIRSLNWGNTTSENRDQIERQRYEAGVLNYKFPGGENTPQFVDAIREFVDEFKQQFQGENALIITHGFALRVLVKAFVRMDDHSFRYLANPPNCFVVKLVQKPKSFGFALKSEMPKADPSTWIQ
jgi:broad specificity phosphatase PhoE